MARDANPTLASGGKSTQDKNGETGRLGATRHPHRHPPDMPCSQGHLRTGVLEIGLDLHAHQYLMFSDNKAERPAPNAA